MLSALTGIVGLAPPRFCGVPASMRHPVPQTWGSWAAYPCRPRTDHRHKPIGKLRISAGRLDDVVGVDLYRDSDQVQGVVRSRNRARRGRTRLHREGRGLRGRHT